MFVTRPIMQTSCKPLAALDYADHVNPARPNTQSCWLRFSHFLSLHHPTAALTRNVLRVTQKAAQHFRNDQKFFVYDRFLHVRATIFVSHTTAKLHSRRSTNGSKRCYQPSYSQLLRATNRRRPVFRRIKSCSRYLRVQQLAASCLVTQLKDFPQFK